MNVLLIRQHAHQSVSELVEGCMQPRLLPEGYVDSSR